MAGETNVGGIVGYLRLDHAQFVRAIDEAIAKTEYLDGKNVDVRVDVDRTGAAAAQFDKIAVEATKAETAVKGVDGSAKKVDTSSRTAGGGVGMLATAIGTIGPALVPIAAGTVGLAGGFAAMGAAGLVAFKGIKDAMSQNNAVGEAYQRGMTGLSTDLEKLGAIAAGNVLAPFQSAVADLQAKMPTLSGMVDEFSTMTGKAASSLVQGLVNAFVELEPMMRTAGVYIVDLTQNFQDMMSGPGIQAFGSYVQSVMPQVVSTIGSLISASSNLVQSFAPLGGGVLTALNGLADGIASINPGILTAVSTAAGAVFTGFKAWQGLSGLVTGLGSALQFVGFSADTAATAVGAFTIAAGAVAAGIGLLVVGFTLIAEHNRNMQQATDDYTEALLKSNGALDENVRLTALHHAEADNTIKDAQELGLSVNDLVDAYLGIPGASDKVKAAYEAQHIALTNQKGELADTAGKVDHLDAVYGHLTGQVGDSAQQIEASKVAYQHQQEVADAASGSVQGLDTANKNLADRMGWNLDTFNQVATSQQKIADKTADATAKMQDQNDAAGLLKQALDELNGKALSNSEAQDAYAKARNGLGAGTKSAEDQLAALEKQKAGLSDGQTPAGGGAAVASAKKNLEWRKQQLERVRNSKHTATQLANAEHNVQVATDRVTAAQTKATTVTGAATQAQRDAIEASITAQRAKVAESKAVDGNSDAALANRDKIRAMMEAGNKAAGTSGELARSNKDARDKLIAVREDIIKTGAKWGWNADKVRAYLDEVDQVPAEITPTKTDVLTAPSIQKIHEFVGVINGVPTWKWVTVQTKGTGDALAALANVREAIAGVRDKTVTITAVYQALGQQAALSAHNATQLDAHHIPNANGSIRMDGVQKMAQGGFAGRESTIMRSTRPILWNEAPGGEAYISLAPEKRARSLAIYGEVGRMLGAGGGGSGSRLHPEDIGALARALGREISRIPTPEMPLGRLNHALGGI